MTAKKQNIAQLETLNGHPWNALSIYKMPPENEPIHVEVIDNMGSYRLPFAVRRTGDKFYHAEKGNEIRVSVKNWRLA